MSRADPRPPTAGGSAATRRRFGWLVAGRVTAVVVALLLPLLLLEGALRLFGPILPGSYDTGHYLERHAEFGHFNVPGFDGWIKTSEFTTRVRISPLGLRDSRTTYERPAAAHRILLLGDSFTEAVQVDASQTVAARLEASLTARAGRPVDVINAGVAGYGTGQEMLLFEREGLRYDPHVVVLVVFLGNDIGDNNYRPDPNREIPTSRPSFELEGESGIRVVAGSPPIRPTDWRQSLRDCCLLYNVFETGVLVKVANGAVRDQPEVEDDARYLVRSLYEVRPEGETLRGWRITERLIARIRDGAQAAGLPLVVIGAPDWLALDADAWRERLGDSRAESGRFAPDAPNRRLGEIAERLALPYLDLYPIFQREGGNRPHYFAIDSHWTPAGHALVARELERTLTALGLDGSH